jgi:transposase InsO family protein
MRQEGLVRGLPQLTQVDQICEACLAGKHRRAPFPSVAQRRSTRVLELFHRDLCGPITPATPSGNRYFLLLVDDYSRYMWAVVLPTKNGAPQAIKHVQAAAERKMGLQLRALRTDRGGEFTSRSLSDYCTELGVGRELTAPFTPQQNGVVEHRNQTLVGAARSMLKAKSLPGWFWGEAIMTAVYVLNRTMTKGNGCKTPYELMNGVTPAVQHLRTFGCVAHVKHATSHLKKLDNRSRPMIFVGYEPGSKAYRAYDPGTGWVQVSRDVVFNEDACWDWKGKQEDPLDFTIDPVVNTFPGFASVTGPRTREFTPLGAQTSVQAHSPTGTPVPPTGSPFSALPTASPGKMVELVLLPAGLRRCWTQTTTSMLRIGFAPLATFLGLLRIQEW